MHFYQTWQKQKRDTCNIHIYQFYLNLNDNYHWTQSKAESDTFCKDVKVTDAIRNKVFKAANMNFMRGWKKIKTNIFGCGYISYIHLYFLLFQGWHSKEKKKKRVKFDECTVLFFYVFQNNLVFWVTSLMILHPLTMTVFIWESA